MIPGDSKYAPLAQRFYFYRLKTQLRGDPLDPNVASSLIDQLTARVCSDLGKCGWIMPADYQTDSSETLKNSCVMLHRSKLENRRWAVLKCFIESWGTSGRRHKGFNSVWLNYYASIDIDMPNYTSRYTVTLASGDSPQSQPSSNLLGKHLEYKNRFGGWVVGEVMGVPRETSEGVCWNSYRRFEYS